MSSDVQENSTSSSRRSAYLTTNHNNYSHLPFRDQPSLAQIRRLEDYIEGNWDQPLSIDALSVIIGVSARSLFPYFQKKRGYSPMQFVKLVRLPLVELLLSPISRVSVGDPAPLKNALAPSSRHRARKRIAILHDRRWSRPAAWLRRCSGAAASRSVHTFPAIASVA